MLIARDLPRITRGDRLADAAIGLIGGAMGGFGGLTGPAPTLWTTLRGWDRDAQRAVFQAFNLSMHGLTMAAYLATGAISGQAGQLFLVVAPAMLVPTLVGARLYRRFSDAAFRKVVLAARRLRRRPDRHDLAKTPLIDARTTGLVPGHEGRPFRGGQGNQVRG